MNIYLASSSARRKALLEAAGYTVHILSVPIDETRLDNETPLELAKRLARQKVEVAIPFAKQTWPIVGGDTVVALENQVFDKPTNSHEATKILTILSGSSHLVMTGYCVYKQGSWYIDSETTQVCFRTLSALEIKRYVDTEEPIGKAGAYAIQGEGSFLVDHISGSLTNVIGLPLAQIIRCLHDIIRS